jgi:hypothetical protein
VGKEELAGGFMRFVFLLPSVICVTAFLILSGCIGPSEKPPQIFQNDSNSPTGFTVTHPEDYGVSNPSPSATPPSGGEQQTGESPQYPPAGGQIPQQTPEAGITAGEPETPPAPNNPEEAQTEGCTTPWDGTYQGTMSDSGEVSLEGKWAGDTEKVVTPFIQTYDFEMTLKCFGAYENFLDDGKTVYEFEITHVKASHPMFGCQAGCVPVAYDDNLRHTDAFVVENGTGDMRIEFENGAHIDAFAFEGLQFSPSGDKLYLKIEPDPYNSIGVIQDSTGLFHFIEVQNCELTADNDHYCVVKSIFPNTIILSKVS